MGGNFQRIGWQVWAGIRINNQNWRSFPEPISYWYDMCHAENESLLEKITDIKPETILEVGCGSGRIINLLLHNTSTKKIFAIDKDNKIINLIKPYFANSDKVIIINDEIYNFFNIYNINFDLIVCMMNTLGNIDDYEIIKLLVNQSNNFIFSVYDQKYYKLRETIYKSRGHKKYFINNKTYYFNDSWIKGLKSKSYTKKELINLCQFDEKKFSIRKISKLLYFIHIFKNSK